MSRKIKMSFEKRKQKIRNYLRHHTENSFNASTASLVSSACKKKNITEMIWKKAEVPTKLQPTNVIKKIAKLRLIDGSGEFIQNYHKKKCKWRKNRIVSNIKENSTCECKSLLDLSSQDFNVSRDNTNSDVQLNEPGMKKNEGLSHSTVTEFPGTANSMKKKKKVKTKAVDESSLSSNNVTNLTNLWKANMSYSKSFNSLASRRMCQSQKALNVEECSSLSAESIATHAQWLKENGSCNLSAQPKSTGKFSNDDLRKVPRRKRCRSIDVNSGETNKKKAKVLNHCNPLNFQKKSKVGEVVTRYCEPSSINDYENLKLKEKKEKQNANFGNKTFCNKFQYLAGSKKVNITKQETFDIKKLKLVMQCQKSKSASFNSVVSKSSGIASKEDKISNIVDKKMKKKPITPSLQDKMTDKLKSARFRYLNEKLYTSTGQDAFSMFQEDLEAFQIYHEGFQKQVAKWPVNPLNVIITAIIKQSADLVIADLGCGEAKLAKSVPNKVYSLDIVALNENVTVCDMAHTPLPSECIDIAVFCLSLMGTNLKDYLIEANRILKENGLLKIAEAESRFTDVENFIMSLKKYGFLLVEKNSSYHMFHLMDFRKIKTVKKKKKLLQIQLKPCVYKKR